MEANRTKVVADVLRLLNHLQHNHLVQAHAVAQRLEAFFEDAMVKDCAGTTKAEDHKYWMPFKNIEVVKSMILSGKPADALPFAQKMLEIL